MALRIAYVTSGMGHTGTAICQALHRAGHRVVAGCGRNRPAGSLAEGAEGAGL